MTPCDCPAEWAMCHKRDCARKPTDERMTLSPEALVIEQEARARSWMLYEKMCAEHLSGEGDMSHRVASRMDIEAGILLGFSWTAATVIPTLRMLKSRAMDKKADQLALVAFHCAPDDFQGVPAKILHDAINEQFRDPKPSLGAGNRRGTVGAEQTHDHKPLISLISPPKKEGK